VCVARPVGERRISAAVPGLHQADHPVRQVVLDVRYAKQVLSDETHGAAAEDAAGDNEVHLVPRLAESGKGPGPGHPRVLAAAYSFEVEGHAGEQCQLEFLNRGRHDGAEECATVEYEQGVLAVDLSVHRG